MSLFLVVSFFEYVLQINIEWLVLATDAGEFFTLLLQYLFDVALTSQKKNADWGVKGNILNDN